MTEKATDDCLAQNLFSKSLAKMRETLTRAFRKAYPDRLLSDVFYVDSGLSDTGLSNGLRKGLNKRRVPRILICLLLSFPYLEELWHGTVRIFPSFFNNIDKVPVCHIHGVSDRLQAQMSDAFISFARTGVPESPLLPKWPACTCNDETTMILDENCRVGHNFDDELIQLHFTQKVFELF